MSIQECLSRVMTDVGAVRKGDRNDSQSFNFRGIDAVVNAVSPALREHGVVVLPTVRKVTASTVEVGRNRTRMGHVSVIVRYRFVGPDGDHLDCTTVGEAMDAGDKATPKAMSVAFRTALLQALALPTDEPDPDSQSYERSAAKTGEEIAAEQRETERTALINEIAALSPDRAAVLQEWAEGHNGEHIKDATDIGGLTLLRDTLKDAVPQQDSETLV